MSRCQGTPLYSVHIPPTSWPHHDSIPVQVIVSGGNSSTAGNSTTGCRRHSSNANTPWYGCKFPVWSCVANIPAIHLRKERIADGDPAADCPVHDIILQAHNNTFICIYISDAATISMHGYKYKHYYMCVPHFLLISHHLLLPSTASNYCMCTCFVAMLHVHETYNYSVFWYRSLPNLPACGLQMTSPRPTHHQHVNGHRTHLCFTLRLLDVKPVDEFDLRKHRWNCGS